MKKLLVIGCLSLAICCLLFAVPSYGQFAKVGTAGAKFLHIGVGGRSVGMGEAFNAVCDDASSLYWNPAGAARITGQAVLLDETRWFAGIAYHSGAFVKNFGPMGNFGLFFSLFSSGSITRTTYEDYEGSDALGTFAYQGLQVGVNYANFFTDKFAAGVNIKYVTEDYGVTDPIQDKGIGIGTLSLDLGTFYWTGFQSLRIGMSILHFAPDVTPSGLYSSFSDDKERPFEDSLNFNPYPFPMIFRFGLAMEVWESESGKLTLALDALHPNDNVERINCGLEFSMNDMLFARLGYKFNCDTEGLTGGIGFAYPLGENMSLGIDYAFADFGYLTDVHRITMGLKF
jgi:hypothetical protein